MEYKKVTYPLKLISSHKEVGNIKTFIFEKSGHSWQAGQSQAYILSQVGETEAENQRWFTISSAPSEGTINISTRITDTAFKQALNKLKPGDEILAYDLGGSFTWEEGLNEPVVMVAAGIGITPFRSILTERHKTGKKIPVTLLYFNRTNEVPFEKELRELEKQHSEFILKIIIGEDVTSDKILKLAPQAMNQILYLSGPEPMVEIIGAELREHQVFVKQDWFPGYNKTNY